MPEKKPRETCFCANFFDDEKAARRPVQKEVGNRTLSLVNTRKACGTEPRQATRKPNRQRPRGLHSGERGRMRPKIEARSRTPYWPPENSLSVIWVAAPTTPCSSPRSDTSICVLLSTPCRLRWATRVRSFSRKYEPDCA